MPSTIAEVLAGHAARDPNAPAIVCAGLQVLSFGDLERHVRRVGAQLRGAGIGSASRVGIALQRGPEAALLNVAICANATVLPFNPNLPSADLREELKRVRLDALIIPDDAEIPDWVEAADDGFALFKATKAVHVVSQTGPGGESGLMRDGGLCVGDDLAGFQFGLVLGFVDDLVLDLTGFFQ